VLSTLNVRADREFLCRCISYADTTRAQPYAGDASILTTIKHTEVGVVCVFVFSTLNMCVSLLYLASFRESLETEYACVNHPDNHGADYDDDYWYDSYGKGGRFTGHFTEDLDI
jgi:hypothetical protein